MKAITLLFTFAIFLNPASCRQQKSNTPSSPTPSRGPDSVVSPIAQNTDSNNEIVIDFEHCVTTRRIRIPVALGSTTYQIVGKNKGGCMMRYGGEVENPQWDGFLDKTCIVPLSLGKQRFSKTQTGVNFYPLASYCKSTSRTERSAFPP